MPATGEEVDEDLADALGVLPPDAFTWFLVSLPSRYRAEEMQNILTRYKKSKYEMV